MQGFKTFARKTTLRFLDPENGSHAITSIVGPNGSGKSNIADAIRWVLGEQSMKTLRGKAATDVIFSGSDGKNRSGYAEVEITFADVEGIDGIDFSEVRISRRLYRDGDSSYYINGQQARLSDVHMLLAQSNVGQKSYSVVGQGQVDHILAASPEERKSFFDDATGVKPLQLKRHRAILKIRRTRDNLEQAELLVAEIGPRLTTLKRLVKRLNQREEVETQLKETQIQYYGTLWNTLEERMKTELSAHQKMEKAVNEQASVLESERGRLATLEEKENEKTEDSSDKLEMTELQKRYDALQEDRAALREKQYEATKKIELAKVRATSTWTPLPLSKIIETIEKVHAALKNKKYDDALKSSDSLLKRLQKPAPEIAKPDQALLRELDDVKSEYAKIVAELTTLKQKMHDQAEGAQKERKSFFALQHRLLAAQDKLHALETQLNDRRVVLARLETRKEDLEREMKETFGEDTRATRGFKEGANTDELYPKIQQLRHKLDMIGGIDEETVAEYEETKERHEFLESQIADLVGGLQETEKLVTELDEQIKSQSEKAFKEIQKHFEHYFKILFGGGTCSLKEIRESDVVTEEVEGSEETEEEIEAPQSRKTLDRVIGIEIQATPPGKRMKSINLLSGGERALTSIALISSIMATNPSPFVILDEVDAALDEANTMRFAKIIDELREHTQFVIVTHNRATMHAADVLYGVSMQQDGVSQLISVKMEEVTSEQELAAA